MIVPAFHRPVIVVSPAPRAGTTLVQRLLCSAPNTLIFGDTVGQEMEFFAKYAAVKEHMMGFQEPHAAATRQAVLGGDTDGFITSLAPSADRYLHGFKAMAFAWLESCVDEARAAERPVWGWKLAGADGMAMLRLAAWFPAARWIWIERGVDECFRSAKAAQMAQGAAEAAAFAQAAQASKAAFESLAVEALRLDFHTMIADPIGTIRRLEQHTGAVGVAERVFSIRVNSTNSSAWVPPAPLTDEEAAALADPLTASSASPPIVHAA